MSKERLDTETLDNAIKAQKIGAETALEKVTVWFLEELKQYRDLEEQGLLLRLPCEVGDKVYAIVDECEGDSAGCYGTCDTCHNRRLGIEQTKFTIDMIDEFENWYFLTQSEAEEKLRELEGK